MYCSSLLIGPYAAVTIAAIAVTTSAITIKDFEATVTTDGKMRIRK